LKQQAVPLQYSVFLGEFGRAALDTLAEELRRRVDPRQDDVRIYRLPERCQAQWLGRQWLPEGVFLGTDPSLLGLQEHLAASTSVAVPAAAKVGDPAAKSAEYNELPSEAVRTAP